MNPIRCMEVCPPFSLLSCMATDSEKDRLPGSTILTKCQDRLVVVTENSSEWPRFVVGYNVYLIRNSNNLSLLYIGTMSIQVSVN